MLISQVLSKKGGEVFTVPEHHSVANLTQRLADHNVGALLVVDDLGEVTGIVSERDVVRAMAHAPLVVTAKVSSIATRDVVYVTTDTTLDDVFALFTNNGFRHAPVTDPSGHLVGMISIRDVVAARMEELASEKEALIEYIRQV